MHGVARGNPIPAAVLAEIVELAYRAQPFGILSGLGAALAFAWLLQGKVPEGPIAGWLAVACGVYFSRAAVGLLHRHSSRLSLPAERLVALMHATLALTGFLWVSLGLIVAWHATDGLAFIFAIFLYVTTFLAQSTWAATLSPRHFLGYLVVCTLPLPLAVWFRPSAQSAALLTLSVLYLVVVAVFAHRSRTRVQRSLAERLRRLELLSELSEQKGDLDRANRAKTQFLAAASHDLRQPLQSISLHVDALRVRKLDVETRVIVDALIDSTGILKELFNALLDISKLDSGAVTARMEHFRIQDLLEELRSRLGAVAFSSGTRLTVIPCSAVVHCDPLLLLSIVHNLLSNALTFAARRRVVVGCRRRGVMLEIQVCDSGPGISADKLQTVFREFYQLDNPERDRRKGLGLGLPLVRRIAKVLHATITVRSTVGAGSMFAVRVPLGDAARLEAERPTTALDDASLMSGCVMVIDDDRTTREGIARLVSGWGCQAYCAQSGIEAVATLRDAHRRPDLIISDFRLEDGETGLDAIRKLRESFGATPAFLITGDPGAIPPDHLRTTGLRVLAKPVAPAKLRSLARNLLRRESSEGTRP